VQAAKDAAAKEAASKATRASKEVKPAKAPAALSDDSSGTEEEEEEEAEEDKDEEDVGGEGSGSGSSAAEKDVEDAEGASTGVDGNTGQPTGIAKRADEEAVGAGVRRRLQLGRARLAAETAAARQPATRGRGLKTKDAAALSVIKWRAAKARHDVCQDGAESPPAAKESPPPRPLATSAAALSALVGATSSSSSSSASAAAPLPTRPVHVCRVSGQARLVLLGARDGPAGAYGPSQGLPGTVLVAAAAAPPSKAFAATAPTPGPGSESRRRKQGAGGHGGGGRTTTVHRGVHWHCLLPAGPAFGHDVGFAETSDLCVAPGGGDSSAWPDLPLLTEEDPAASNAVAIASSAAWSAARTVKKEAAAAGSVRGDPRLERMSWAGSGGGRCPGGLPSQLHVPIHPWPLGTQVNALYSFSHCPLPPVLPQLFRCSVPTPPMHVHN
jgi:hypothetical protein